MKAARRLVTGLTVALILGTTLAPAFADQPPTALAPIETILDGRDELVGVAVATDGTRYVSDRGAGLVYRVSPNGALATAASGLSRPAGLAFDSAGRLLIAEEQTGKVLRLEPNGSLTALASGIKTPRWLVVNPDGSLYIAAHRLTEPDGADTSEGRDILLLTPGGALSVVATGIRQLQGLTRLNGALIAATKGLQGGPDSAGALLRYTVNANGSLGTPTTWLSTGLKQPVGLVLDVLSALYASSKELLAADDTSKRAIGKVHPDVHFSDFASNLSDPQGLALGPDGSLYLADGKGGRLLRFRAPAAPTLNTPPFTKQSPLTVTGTTEAGARVDLFLNEATTPVVATADSTGAFTAQLTLITDHSNSLEAFATSHGGNGLTSVAAEATIVHDGQPPTLSFQAPPAGAYVRLSVNVQAQASDPGSNVASLGLTVDGVTLTATVSPSLPAPSATATATWVTTSVADGTHTLGVTATDRASNTATATRVVIVDNTPPDTQITGGPTGEIAVGATTFTFTGTDNLTPVANLQFAWRLNGAAFSAFGPATTTSLTGLAEGAYTFEVKARDLAGNEDPTPATRSFTVRFGPVITGVTPASGPTGTFVTITGTNFEPGTTTVSFNGLSAVVRSVTATQITATVPIGATGPLTVTTSRGSASQAFTVTTTGDFTLTAAPAPPAKVRVIAGDQGSARIDVGGSGSFASLVALNVSGPPSGITASFSTSFAAPGSGSFLTLAVASTVNPGTFALTVTGQAQVDGQTQSRTASVTLEVLAASTPAVTGRVLTAEAVPRPIAGVTVALGSAFALTDAAGNFVLLAPPTGPNMLLVDGRTASTPTAQYPPVEVQITLSTTGATRVPFTLYLPQLDTANPITLPLNASGATTQEVRATTPLIPGLVVTIPQGTRINGPDGNPVAQIVITPVPIDRSPMPFPPGVKPSMLFAIQPGGAVPSQPLPITFPNRTRAAPGTGADLYYFDLVSGNWLVWGHGTVSQDGSAIVSDPGFGLPRFAWHFPAPAAFDPGGDEGGPQDADGGDPVDVAIGRFTLSRTDMFLPGRLNVSIQREYRSENPQVGLFGIGWNLSPYDSVISNSGTSLQLTLPSRSSFRFTPSGPGRWVNVTDPFVIGAVLTQIAGGLNFELRFKDGLVHRYAPLQTFTNAAGLIAVVDRNGNTVTVTRETVGANRDRITRIVEPSGKAITLAYDSAGRIVTVTDPIARVVRYDYDAQGRLMSVTDPGGGLTRYTYDSTHRLLTATNARGITSIDNQYDTTGRVARQLLPDGGAWTFEYAVSGALVTQTVVTNPRGGRTSHRFDARGFLLSRTDALGRTTIYEYEPGYNLVRSVTDALGRLTRFTRDALGNITSVVGPSGATLAFTYEPTFSRATETIDEAGRITRFEYDGHGNIVTLVDPSGARTTNTYDGFGQLMTTTNALSATRRFAYDAQGNRTAVTDPLGNISRSTYDAVGRLVRQTDPRGRTTAFTYSPVNRLTEVRDPATGVTTYAYDPNGNVLSVTSPRGGAIVRSYDTLDRMVAQVDPLGAREVFAYDRNGNLVTYTDRANRIESYGYDALDRRIAATYADGTTTQASLDAVGRVIRVDDSVAGPILNRYDERDRLVEQVGPNGTVRYEHDTVGRRTRMDASGSTGVTYRYDANSRLTEVSQGGSSATLTYDLLGRRASLTLPNGLVTMYGYDPASRLTSLVYRTPSVVLGELTYQYDPAGYRIRTGGSLADTLLPPAVTSATYDAAGRQLTFGDTHTTFDANGNATSISGPGGTTALTWDARNRLIAITSPVATAEYTYDSFGRRIMKRAGGAAPRYLYDDANIVQEWDAGSTVGYLRSGGIDELLMIERPDGRFFPSADGIGSTILLTNEAGETTARYAYDAFGTTTSTNPAFPNPFRFTGRELDETGLYYYRARYYSPTLHRFLSPDPLRRTSESAYVYASNNPLTFTDPSGLTVIVIQGGLPTSAPGGVSGSVFGSSSATDQLVAQLQAAGEPVLLVTNSQDLQLATSFALAIGMDLETVNIVGFSAGGPTAVALANLLNERGIAVGTLVTIDSVSMIDPFGPDAPVIPANVDTNLNFYQNQTSVLHGGPNTAKDPRTTVENILVPKGHFDIAEDPGVIDMIVNRIHPPLDKPK